MEKNQNKQQQLIKEASNMSDFNLDLTEVKEQTGFAPIPAGTYFVLVDDVSIKETKSGTGSYINTKFRILEGSQEGRFLFHTFNIKNENSKAVEIGLAQLKTFMKCAGATEFKLTNVLDLAGMRADAVVKIKHDDQYGDKAVISYFRPHAQISEAEKKSANPFG